jgi:outer membrane protein
MSKKTINSSVLKYLSAVLILLTCCNLKIFAQDNNKVYLTLEEAISTALKKNNQLKASEYSLEKANWDSKHAWTLLIPSLNLNSRFTHIDDQTFAERDFRRYLPEEFADQIPQTVFQESYYTSFEASMPIFNSEVFTNISVAGTSEDMAEYMYISTRENIIFQVVSSYLDVLKTREVVNLQKEYLELSRLNYEKAERLEKADRYSKSEALRWKVEYQTQKGVLVNSQSNLRSQNIALYRLLNMNMDENIEIVGDLSDRLKEESEKLYNASQEEILNMVNLSEDELLKSNSALSVSKLNSDISEKIHSGSYLSYLPNVSVSYSYGWRENGSLALDDYSPKNLMVNFSMPIFSGFKNYTNVQSTYYDYKKSEEEYEDQLKNTRFMLIQTVNKIINLKTQKELSKTNVELTENNYRIVEKQKEMDLVSNIDFIDAKLNLQNAKLTDVHNHYDFVIAMVELYYMLGKIDQLVD